MQFLALTGRPNEGDPIRTLNAFQTFIVPYIVPQASRGVRIYTKPIDPFCNLTRWLEIGLKEIDRLAQQ